MKKNKQSGSQFDLKVHARDGKGHIKSANHYRLEIKNGIKRFERPPGSGNFFAENGEPIEIKGKKIEVKPVPEFNEADLVDEVKEISMTADDVKVDDVEGSSDISEELEIMKAAGVDASKIEEKKALFSKPSFLK